ncbi:hypothetical protein [Pedococcus sp. 5OH_020]|uniref:hypothetical protein n=1 Tax=Pedococcus sp. 5OH_020 TaxID=2989814 RepID=UPI0022E9E99F|nr:hypothetical protein [Pedococcus sp. 5OH_020]
MDDQLDEALRVPGFETRRDDRRVVFTSSDDGQQVVTWSVARDDLRRLAADRRAAARSAHGSVRARGEWLLAEHVREALLTFSGRRGVMTSTPTGLDVRSLD